MWRCSIDDTSSDFSPWSRFSVAHWRMLHLPPLRSSTQLCCEWVAHRSCKRSSICHMEPLYRKTSRGIAVGSFPHRFTSSCRRFFLVATINLIMRPCSFFCAPLGRTTSIWVENHARGTSNHDTCRKNRIDLRRTQLTFTRMDVR